MARLSGDGTEKAIRKQMIENNLVEAIVVLPQDMFYTTKHQRHTLVFKQE